MGLIKALQGAGSGVLGDQWREYFYCDSMPENVLVVKGQKRVTGRSSNTSGVDNIITNGSVIAVADGQCMMIVDQGRIAEFTAEPGEFTYDASTEPSIFYGGFGKGLLKSFSNLGKRFTFGGEAPKDQRVYYFNTKELFGNRYGTPSPVPFRVVDEKVGLDMDVGVRCHGEYTYRICDPMLFYKNVCGNITESYTRDRIDSQLKAEMLTALQPAFAKIAEMGVRYYALSAHTLELAESLNEILSPKWREKRGIEIVSIGVSSATISEEDQAMFKEMQRSAALGNAKVAAGHLVGAQAEAMKTAAGNKSGAMMGFMGMGMAQQAGGMNATQLFQQVAQQDAARQQAAMAAPAAPAAPAGAAQPAPGSWTCSCGATVNGNFCPQCGSKKPAPKVETDTWKCSCGATVSGNFCPECGSKRPEAKPQGWTCSCGALNKGKFCTQCGAKKPAGVPQYRCDKCGWEPADPAHPPKFCPECGDPFGDEDVKQ